MLKRWAKEAAITAGLELSALLRAGGLMRRARGLGAIFTLHHVRPFFPQIVQPNRHLEITPEFLEAAIVQLKADGYRFARLEDVPTLLAESDDTAPFAVFTLDDGYRDNRDFALPVFERHGVPCTIFVCKGFSERSHSIWWETADRLVNGGQAISINDPTGMRTLSVRTPGERDRTFSRLSDMIPGDDETSAVARLDAAALAVGVDPFSIPQALVMDARELAAIAAHPLVSLGAHTVSHRALTLLEPAVLAQELAESTDYIEGITGKRPASFAYPYGDGRSVSTATIRAVERAGFTIAVTTRPGTLTPHNSTSLAALPRISLNGFYQKPRYVSALASGIPFKLGGR